MSQIRVKAKNIVVGAYLRHSESSTSLFNLFNIYHARSADIHKYFLGNCNIYAYLFVYDLAKSVRHAQYWYFLLKAFVVLLNIFYSWFRYFLIQTHVWFSLIFLLLNIILLFGHSSLTIWTNKSILEVWVSVLIHVHFDSFFSSTRIQFRNQFLYCY